MATWVFVDKRLEDCFPKECLLEIRYLTCCKGLFFFSRRQERFEVLRLPNSNLGHCCNLPKTQALWNCKQRLLIVHPIRKTPNQCVARSCSWVNISRIQYSLSSLRIKECRVCFMLTKSWINPFQVWRFWTGYQSSNQSMHHLLRCFGRTSSSTRSFIIKFSYVLLNSRHVWESIWLYVQSSLHSRDHKWRKSPRCSSDVLEYGSHVLRNWLESGKHWLLS